MRQEYIHRINKALAYIDQHLEGELSLRVVSEVACYSPFHLHRLFKAVTNENLNAYITRKRVERSALMLMHNEEYSISEIAFKYGFNSDANFSRTFKKIYGQSPKAFRKSNLNNFSKIGKVDSKNGTSGYITEEYLCNINNLKQWIKMNAKIEIVDMPKMNMVYVTHMGVKGIENAFLRIVRWAAPKELLAKSGTFVCRVFHDSYKVTDADKVRMSIGVVSEEALPVDGEVEVASLEKGKTIVGRFVIEPIAFETAWNSLFVWMNEKGYKRAERYPFEMYHNNFNEHPERKCIVDLCIPIE